MISLSVGELKPALAGLAKVVSAKARLECLCCVRVDAKPGQVSLTGTDLDMFAQVELPEAKSDSAQSFLLPLDRLQSLTRRLQPGALLYLEPDKIACDLGSGRVSESVTSPDVKEFPEVPTLNTRAEPLPESFARRFTEAMGCSSTDATRYILNGVQLDVSEPGSHYLVGTDGRHLFSANSFALPLSTSVTIGKHKLLAWRGLSELPWALAGEKKETCTLVRIVAGDWTLTMKTLEGGYPNWRQVVPKTGHHRTRVTLPIEHDFGKILSGLPGGDSHDKPVTLVIENGSVSVKDTKGGSALLLAGATSKGPDLKICLNRDYLAKAFDYGLTRIGLIDAISPLHFTCEGRQMVVMPLRLADAAPVDEPEKSPTPTAPPEPQPERKPMIATNAHPTNGATAPRLNGANRSTPEKPAIEAAIEKLEASKATLREAVAGLTELTTLLKQSVRDQKAGEKEIHQVRQTLRSLQSVRI
jgi:DNA polymerase III sliding clamp (beta) subunit (PCNA family)